MQMNSPQTRRFNIYDFADPDMASVTRRRSRGATRVGRTRVGGTRVGGTRVGRTLMAAITIGVFGVAMFATGDRASAQSRLFASELDRNGDSDTIVIEAVTKARHDLELGFPTQGLVAEVLVEPGDTVKEGDLLVKLVDLEPRAMLEQAVMQADSTLSVEAAQAQLDQAEIELASVQRMFDKNATTKLERDRAEVAFQIRKLEFQLAEQQRRSDKMAMDRASAILKRYEIRAPKSGEIVDVMIDVGEPFEEREPAIRLVVTSTLRIDAPVPTAATLGMNVGDPAWVMAKLDKGLVTIKGKIVYVAPVADAASDTRIIRVEMANDLKWPAGSHVLVRFTDPNPKSEADETDEADDVDEADEADPMEKTDKMDEVDKADKENEADTDTGGAVKINSSAKTL